MLWLIQNLFHRLVISQSLWRICVLDSYIFCSLARQTLTSGGWGILVYGAARRKAEGRLRVMTFFCRWFALLVPRYTWCKVPRHARRRDLTTRMARVWPWWHPAGSTGKIFLIHLQCYSWKFLECLIFGVGREVLRNPDLFFPLERFVYAQQLGWTWLTWTQLDRKKHLKKCRCISDAEDCGCSGDMFSFHSGPLGWKGNENEFLLPWLLEILLQSCSAWWGLFSLRYLLLVVNQLNEQPGCTKAATWKHIVGINLVLSPVIVSSAAGHAPNPLVVSPSQQCSGWSGIPVFDVRESTGLA